MLESRTPLAPAQPRYPRQCPPGKPLPLSGLSFPTCVTRESDRRGVEVLSPTQAPTEVCPLSVMKTSDSPSLSLSFPIRRAPNSQVSWED